MKHFLKFVTLLTISIASTAVSLADTAVVDGITWTYTVKDGEASIGGGSNSSIAVPKSTSGALVIPSSLGVYPVTSISKWAFYGCTKMTSVTIPDSVTTIGANAFDECRGLAEVTIPSSVTNIGTYAFGCCTGLATVNIANLSAWCNILFNDRFANPIFYAKKLCVNGEMISGDLRIPEGVKCIGGYAFCDYCGLTGLMMPNSVTNIGKGAFLNCSGLSDVTIPNSVKRIGELAFWGCSGLTNVVIPNSVTWIGGSAFRDCGNLMRIELPFIGSERDADEYTHFGYIFGANSYSDNSKYVPENLRVSI